MKILVLENDPREFALIQQSLSENRHSLMQVATSEQAWAALQKNESRFLIANWDTSDIQRTQLIQRLRASKSPGPVYILLTTSKGSEEDLDSAQADDLLHKPYKPQELKNRVAMAERILSLASNLASARGQLETQAIFDPQTGLMNRAAFLRQSSGELERARRASVPLSLIALDIDNFKNITDVHGSQAGEEVLRIVSQILRERSRPYDCISRWEGNEFLILVTGVIGADAEKIAERVIVGVRATPIEVIKDTQVKVKMSAGIASASRISASTEVESLIGQSRQAMARAKEAGGDQVFLAYI